MPEDITPEQVRKVARLSRLSLTDDEAAVFARELGAVLGYVEQLSELDLEGVEPMTHVEDVVNRLDEDEAGPTLPNESLMKMAPDPEPPFIGVPKVLGDGGGA